jgi:hypothetical protein
MSTPSSKLGVLPQASSSRRKVVSKFVVNCAGNAIGGARRQRPCLSKCPGRIAVGSDQSVDGDQIYTNLRCDKKCSEVSPAGKEIRTDHQASYLPLQRNDWIQLLRELLEVRFLNRPSGVTTRMFLERSKSASARATSQANPSNLNRAGNLSIGVVCFGNRSCSRGLNRRRAAEERDAGLSVSASAAVSLSGASRRTAARVWPLGASTTLARFHVAAARSH